MKYLDNEYKTCGTAALKPQAARGLVLVQGGSRGVRSFVNDVLPCGLGCAPQATGFAASDLLGCVREVLGHIEPLPEPMAASATPSHKQEVAGFVACLGCVVAVLLMATLFEALI